MNITFFALYAAMLFLCSSLSYVDLLLAGSRLFVCLFLNAFNVYKIFIIMTNHYKVQVVLVYRLKKSVNLFHSSLAEVTCYTFFTSIF